MKIFIDAEKVKKFDIIEFISGLKTVDYVKLSKGEKYCKIMLMDKTSIGCLCNEKIQVNRDKFYSVTHRRFTDFNSVVI